MESWEKVFIAVILGLVTIIAIANAVYLCCGRAGQSWPKRRSSSKR
jgi:hypothetical protein